MIKSRSKLNKLLKCIIAGFIGILGGFFLILSDFKEYGIVFIFKTVIQNGLLSDFLVNFISPCAILCILAIISYLVGIKTDKALEDFRKIPDKKDIKFWVLIVVSAIILPIGYFYMQTLVTNRGFYVFNIYALLKAICYDSIVGELFFNFCITSLIVFLVSKVFFKKDKKLNKLGLILSVVFSVLFVFSIQLNSLFNLYSVINAMFLLWAVLQYLVMDAIYAYLYVRYGLKWSIFVHVIFTIMLLGVCPLLLV